MRIATLVNIQSILRNYISEVGDSFSALRLNKKLFKHIALSALFIIFIAIVKLLEAHGREDTSIYHATLPYYASADLKPRWDTISSWHRVPSVLLRNQYNQLLDDQVFFHGISIVSFFFTACNSVCPASTEMLLMLHNQLNRQIPKRPLQFISLSIAPQSDTPREMLSYANKYGLPGNWILATGNHHEISQVAREGFYSDIDTLGLDGLPPHINRAFLVDQEGKIRGVYDLVSPHVLERIKNDINLL